MSSESTQSTVTAVVDGYLEWLRAEIKTKEVRGWIEIETPFLDWHNDYIVVYGRQKAGRWEFTDDGRTVADLEMSGVELNTEHRKALFKSALNGLGVKATENVLYSSGSLGEAKNSLLQAIIAVGDLHVLSRSSVKSIFFEDVRTWFAGNDLRPVTNVKVDGTTSSHKFDFVFPSSGQTGERYVRLMPTPSVQKAELAAFAWFDSKDGREANSQALAILENEEGSEVNPKIEETLRNYGVEPYLWDEREDKLRLALAA